jgi:hypothetical protein
MSTIRTKTVKIFEIELTFTEADELCSLLGKINANSQLAELFEQLVAKDCLSDIRIEWDHNNNLIRIGDR